MPGTFTVEEARALLPEVRAIAESMREHKREFERQRTLLKDVGTHAAGNGHGSPDALAAQTSAERQVQEIQNRIEQLARMGVEVKGIDEGLVDFPSIRDGRVVYLCWRVGEPDILYWHEVEAGFRGRQPLT
jgi:hypothetical protein